MCFLGKEMASKLPIRRSGKVDEDMEVLTAQWIEDDTSLNHDFNVENQEQEEESNDGVTPTIHDIPYEGKEFNSEQEAYEFYNTYAKKTGFSIRKSWYRKSKASGELIARNFCCSKQGERESEEKNEFGRRIKKTRSGREGCLAVMYIIRKDSALWVVQKFILEHNHILATPTKVIHLRSHNRLSDVAKDLSNTLSVCGIRPSKIAQVLQEGGNDGITSHQISAHKRKVRQSNIGQECMSVVRFFQQKSNADPHFFSNLNWMKHIQLEVYFGQMEDVVIAI